MAAMGITTITATVEIMDTEDSIKDTQAATDSVEALTKDIISWTNTTISVITLTQTVDPIVVLSVANFFNRAYTRLISVEWWIKRSLTITYQIFHWDNFVHETAGWRKYLENKRGMEHSK